MIRPGPLMADVAGLLPTTEECQFLADPTVGGVILFARNYSDRAQLAELTARLHAIDRPSGPLFIAVDHEGGRVQRFRDGYTRLPPMRALGRLHDLAPDGALAAAVDHGFVLGGELRRDGVDLSFAPVLDLDWGPSAIIGERAFHRDPKVVARLARAVCHGLMASGMAACGKHFPGHGAVAADSHLELPIGDRPLDAILHDDALPYVLLGDVALPSVMTAHVLFPQVDAQPASFSRLWLDGVLRQRLRYDGAVLSDDLGMAGAHGAGEIEARSRAALDAGCDMVLVCNQPELARRAARAPGVADRLGTLPGAHSARRLARLHARGPVPTDDALARAAERLMRALDPVSDAVADAAVVAGPAVGEAHPR